MTQPLHKMALGGDAVLSLDEAAAWLPLPVEQGREWLRRAGVVRVLRLGDGDVEVVIWGDVVEKVRAIGAESFPITTWRGAARVLGVSEDTLARKRAAAGDDTPPYFADEASARAWYTALVAPHSQRPRRCRRPLAAADESVDWNAVARGTR